MAASRLLSIWTKVLISAIGLISICIVIILTNRAPVEEPDAEPIDDSASSFTYVELPKPELCSKDRVITWWQPFAEEIRKLPHGTAKNSNVKRSDYVGVNKCQKCHQEQYAGWHEHPHRVMNARATEETVKGDFSGTQTISYLGGEGSFYREEDQWRMRLIRGSVERVYQVNRTIGSRFFQYYVGVQIEGPEPADLPVPISKFDYVLPFGYWLSQHQWVPTVHVGEEEYPDGKRVDPFSHSPRFQPYDSQCAVCHTTFPAGDRLMMFPDIAGTYSPYRIHWQLHDFLSTEHPEVIEKLGGRSRYAIRPEDIKASLTRPQAWASYPVQLGIVCEGCHHGCREHASDPNNSKPRFIASGEFFHLEAPDTSETFGRTQKNLNWVCARCHSGGRPQFAAGMSTWNSTEYSDAVRGSCYSELTCVHCHDPHQKTGPKWTLTPAKDDDLCLSCHAEFGESDHRRAHTHHDSGSAGSHCMDCHMPKINEGLNDVVRTHTIFSPTNRKMIEANQPNACNLCHLDKSITWTAKYLKEWYNTSFSEADLKDAYVDLAQPVGLGWLNSEHESTRMVAARAMTDGKASWALAELVEILDDPFLLNRQFGQRNLERMLGIRMLEFGYRFYQMPEERREPITRIRNALLNSSARIPPKQ